MSMSRANDSILLSLFDTPQNPRERALAARYAPVIRFDAREPFLPLAAGYTVFRHSSPSPSFRQGYRIDLTPEDHSPASLAIEYAIWWDWDIGHLYELEHAWVYVGEEGQVIRGEASWHGRYHDMRHDGQLALEGDHLVLYSEPGKHAFAPTPEWFQERRRRSKRSPTSALAGIGGVLMTHYLEGRVICTPLQNLLVRSYLAREAFEPSWDFSQVFEFKPDMLVPWPALADWIPTRVNDWLARLERDIPTSSYRFLRIGHRGAAAHAPGNTLAGLRKAAELGADMVEFDVRQTADRQAVLMHDPHLVDAEGRVWPARRSTMAELQAIDLGGGERVPTLADALEVCRSERMGAYIELKEGDVIPAVVSAIRERGLAKYSIVGSFRPDWLASLKAAIPESNTSILFSSPHLDAVKLAHAIDATYVHPCWKDPDPSALITSEWVATVRKAGLGIICGHEERPEVIAALRRVGVDAICSDAPELLQD